MMQAVLVLLRFPWRCYVSERDYERSLQALKDAIDTRDK